MTTKNTTGDKLVASIRKTKTGTATAGSEPAKKKVARKAAPKSKKKAAPAKATPTTRERNARLVDLFQSGRRVWPD